MTELIPDFVKPICLPLTPELRRSKFDGYDLEVAGWGKTENSKLYLPFDLIKTNERLLTVRVNDSHTYLQIHQQKIPSTV